MLWMRTMIKRIKSWYAGSNTLIDWLGHGGKPVAQELAEKRADVCRTCPKNVQGDWWDRVTAEVAVRVLDQRREKEKLCLRLPRETELGTCDVCLCHLPVKSYVPIEHIIQHTSDEVWNQLPPHCWIKHEGSGLRLK